MSLLEDAKKATRTMNNFYDDELTDLLNAGKRDLRIAGIFFEDEQAGMDIEPLVKRALMTYVKANFGYDNPDADRLHDSYVMLKQHLALSGDYREME